MYYPILSFIGALFAAVWVRFEAVQSLVRSVRNAKAEYKVEPGKKIPAVVQVSDVTELIADGT